MSTATSINKNCIISRDEAAKLAPDLVTFTEDRGEHDLFSKVDEAQNKVKRGQTVVVAFKNWKEPTKSTYAIVQVSSVKHGDWRNEDGPVIRVTDGKMSWRTDGCDWIAPVKG